MADSSLPAADTRLRSVPLERKLPLLVLGLFALVLAATLAVSYYEVRTSAIETAGDRLRGVGQVFGSLVEQQTAGRLNLLRRVARDTSIQKAFRSPDRPLDQAALRALAPLATAPADSATPPQLWDARGQPFGAHRLEPSSDLTRFRDEVTAAANDSGHVTHLRVSNGRASYYDAVPVRGVDGTLLGYIAQERRINVNPRALPLLRGLIGSDIDFYLRNADDNTWVQLTGAAAPPPTNSRRTTDSLEMYTHGAAGSMLAATTAIRGTPLLLTAERPMSSILARPLSTIRVLSAFAIVLAVVGALAVWFLSRRLVRPLGALTTAAEQMARGRYSQRVAVAGEDEVARLGIAFNRMAEEVEASAVTSARAVARLTRAVETQEFLAEASRILAGSVSDETLLTDLTRYCVPKLADYCSIHVLDDDGDIRRIQTAHRDPAMLPLIKALHAHYPYTVESRGDVPTVIRTQQPAIIPEIDLESAMQHAPDARAADLLARIRPSAMMVVPLSVRGRSFGAISFVLTGGDRNFASDDLDIAMELARRSSVAIDNAVIYRRSIQLRLEAEAASNAKSDFLAKMSHEIRTPINAMMGYAELLQMGISGPVTEAQSKQLGRIRASGDHLTELIGEILDLAKIEAGQMSVQPKIAPIGEAVEAALTIIRPAATTKGVELASLVSGNPEARYFGDPQRVQQILTNLLSNAVKFTPSGGMVSVRCDTGSRPGVERSAVVEWVCVTVRDTGVGIAAEHVERIFQPFVQVETGYTRSQGGTGLGLTISRNLAQLMGGDIDVESEPGQGSAFSLWLPCPIRALAVV